jgi:signal peptidase I
VAAAYLWLGRVYYVSSASMAPTLEAGERILVSIPARSDIQRGDIVVVDVRTTWASTGEVGSTVVKRVIGLPGEQVSCCTPDGAVSIDGEPLDEPYVHTDDRGPHYDIVVPAGRVWLLGDDRGNSKDSRDHLGSPGSGTVSTDDVIGRAIAVIWPPVQALPRSAG